MDRVGVARKKKTDHTRDAYQTYTHIRMQIASRIYDSRSPYFY